LDTVLSLSTLLAVMLLAAIIGGHVAGWVRVPRVVGFIVAGVVLKLIFDRAYSADASARGELTGLLGSLSVVRDLALGLILFTIGEAFERFRLRPIARTLPRISLAEILLTFLFTTAGCAAAAWTLRVPGFQMTFSQSLAIGLLLGAAAIATAPAATWLVLREYEAKGPTTDHLLGLLGINNLVSIVAFIALFLLCARLGWLDGLAAGSGRLWLDLLFVSVGSLLLGALLGALLSALHARLTLPEMILFFFGVLLTLSAGEEWLRAHLGAAFNPMVTALAMGVVFANTALNTVRFERTLVTVSTPVFALFFVLAGCELHLADLPALGLFGTVYIAMRTLGKVLGVRAGVVRAGPESMLRRDTGLALLCQAGVAIGLASFLVRHWVVPGDEPGTLVPHALAMKLNVVILGSVALYELVGPLLVKRTVVKAGEVKGISLLRPGAAPARRPGLAATIQRAIGRRPTGPLEPGDEREQLTARHLMRTNVKFLPAQAPLEEVLHFIERSRFHDFAVVDPGGRYLGMVHLSRLRDLFYSPTLDRMIVATDLADDDVPAITAEASLAELLELFHEYDTGTLPVVDGEESNRLVGVVEQRDLFRALHLDYGDLTPSEEDGPDAERKDEPGPGAPGKDEARPGAGEADATNEK